MIPLENNGWHRQILSKRDLVHYSQLADVLKYSDGKGVRMPMSATLRETVEEYLERAGQTDVYGVRNTNRTLHHYGRRMRYILMCLSENGYWLVAKLSRDSPDMGNRVIVEFAVVAPIYHRLIDEGTRESYRVYIPVRPDGLSM